MKKSVAILIGIIYIASIFIINLFGLKMSVYNEKHSVAKIECVNKAGDGVVTGKTLYPVNGASTPRDQWQEIMYIAIKFEGAASINDSGQVTGTNFLLQMRVYPDNATNKNLTFTNYSNNSNVEFHIVGGNQNCLVLFSKPTTVVIKVTPKEENNPAYCFVKLIAS